MLWLLRRAPGLGGHEDPSIPYVEGSSTVSRGSRSNSVPNAEGIAGASDSVVPSSRRGKRDQCRSLTADESVG